MNLALPQSTTRDVSRGYCVVYCTFLHLETWKILSFEPCTLNSIGYLPYWIRDCTSHRRAVPSTWYSYRLSLRDIMDHARYPLYYTYDDRMNIRTHVKIPKETKNYPIVILWAPGRASPIPVMSFERTNRFHWDIALFTFANRERISRSYCMMKSRI